MNARIVVLGLLMVSAAAIAPPSGYADHIYASVDGVNVGPDNHDVCSLGGDPYLLLAADCNGGANTYGRLVISGAGAGNPARIVVKSDGIQDNLTLTGATIRTNVAAGSTLTDGPFSFWTVPLAQLPNTSTYGGDIGYQLDVVGSFFRPGSRPLNDRIWVDTYLQHPVPGSWSPAMNHYDKTMTSTSCPQNNVPCNFSNAPSTPYNVSPGFDDSRGAKTTLLITIRSGDTLTIPTDGLVVKSTAPGGQPGGNSVTSGCPSGPFSSTCWTAKALGCYACAAQQTATKEQQVKLFASSNWENLSQDLARGGGEHLASLASLLRVPVEHQTEFFSIAQDRYQTLAAHRRAAPEVMVDELQKAMTGHPTFAKVILKPAD